MNNMKTFTSTPSQGFAVPSGPSVMKVTLVGGGAAGGYSGEGCSGAGGGGAGGVIIFYADLNPNNRGNPLTITVGAGGQGTESSANPGTSTSISFQDAEGNEFNISAGGGAAGANSTEADSRCWGGAGGRGSANGGNWPANIVLLSGGSGGTGMNTSSKDVGTNFGGNGGSCMFGQGGVLTAGNFPAQDGLQFGAGGAGASVYGRLEGPFKGGDGAGGLVIIEY